MSERERERERERGEWTRVNARGILNRWTTSSSFTEQQTSLFPARTTGRCHVSSSFDTPKVDFHSDHGSCRKRSQPNSHIPPHLRYSETPDVVQLEGFPLEPLGSDKDIAADSGQRLTYRIEKPVWPRS